MSLISTQVVAREVDPFPKQITCVNNCRDDKEAKTLPYVNFSGTAVQEFLSKCLGHRVGCRQWQVCEVRNDTNQKISVSLHKRRSTYDPVAKYCPTLNTVSFCIWPKVLLSFPCKYLTNVFSTMSLCLSWHICLTAFKLFDVAKHFY